MSTTTLADGAVSDAVLRSPPSHSAEARLPLNLKRWRLIGVLATLAWLAMFAGWVALAPLSGSAVGAGTFKVDTNRKTVSHRDGGNVAQIHVREGQVVKAGDLLFTLEDVRLDASVDLLRVQVDAELLRESRLGAEATMAAGWRPEANAALAASAKRAPDALQRERAAFAARREALEAQLATARRQATDITQETEAHQRNLVSSTEALRLAREEMSANEALLKDNFMNRTRVMGLQRTVAEYESRIHTIEADLAQARQHKSDLDGRLATLRQAHVQAAADEQRESTARLADLQARLRAASDSSRRQKVLAPVGGKLVDLKVHTTGSAVGPREPLVDIVPEGMPLLAETRLGADAISGVRLGQAADIHLPGHAFRQLGMLPGKVVNISADALTEARSGAPYFTVLVEPTPEALARLRAAAGEPTPGMAVEVFINTSRRSALEFLFDPLGSALRRAFRDQ